MPPSTIPQAQVQAMIAELRTGAAFQQEPVEAPLSRQRKRRPWVVATIFLVGGAVLGGGAAVLGNVMGLFEREPAAVIAPTAMAITAPVKVVDAGTPGAAAPPPTPIPAPRPAAALRPATNVPAPTIQRPITTAALPSHAAFKTPAKTIRPRTCIAGGPCSAVDLATAERRLQVAYRSAQRAGVSKTRLAVAHRQWDELKARADDEPRAAVVGYRRLSAQLSRRHAAPKARTRASARTYPDRDPPMIPFRRAR